MRTTLPSTTPPNPHCTHPARRRLCPPQGLAQLHSHPTEEVGGQRAFSLCLEGS